MKKEEWLGAEIAKWRSEGAVDAATADALLARYPVNESLIGWGAVTRVRLLPVDPFPNLKQIGEVKCRVLMIHGTADRVVPFSQGQALFKLANEPKRFVAVEGGGHNSLPDGLGGEEYLKLIKGLADGDDLAAKNAESARDVL